MHGDCVECSFPIFLPDAQSTVTCPFCNTIQQPVTGISAGAVLLLAAITIGIFALKK